ncbi:unnamed protein product, partial [Effrenium voratum]
SPSASGLRSWDLTRAAAAAAASPSMGRLAGSSFSAGRTPRCRASPPPSLPSS